MTELYRRIWELTARQQIVLMILSVIVAALAAAPLEFQKSIINGLDQSMEKDRLVFLCVAYFCVLAVISSLRFAMNYRSSVLSEHVIRKSRARLYERHQESKNDDMESRGKIVTMIGSEAEAVGKFAGDAIASPLLQIGTLVSVITYIASTQPTLGIVLVLVILPQMLIAVSLQKQINERIATSITLLRKATGKITAEKVKKIEQSVLDEFDSIFEAKRSVFLFKLSMKFALNLITGLGTAGILMLGGWLYLDGRTDIGSIVAALSALQRISEPWRGLINFYREVSAVRIRFNLLVGS